MKTNDIRQAFLDYFKSKEHEIVASSSLIPAGDPTLLFVNSGMVQFKDCFLGIDKRAYSRATTSQKCLRISGKHNDLENVGRTARHHTFFEMLGNFSFGDYFKQDAIKFAWEFLTVELGLPKERLWVSIFENDDEAKALWQEHTDVLDGRILRYGEKENFWAMGDTGPCGPCSEIHYYLGEDINNQSEEHFRQEDGTYIEIWNLVFMQFNRDTAGTLHPLPKPSVDTGMGLERIAAVKQGVKANYDTDQMRSIIAFTEELSSTSYLGKDYTERDLTSDRQYAIDVAHRVICDHVRAVSFLMADGVLPASDGRGYVMRRLIRRACRHGQALGFDSAVLYKVAEHIVELMGDVYPDLQKERSTIIKVLRNEEEKFIETLDSGIKVLEKETATLQQAGTKVFPGRIAFTLHDTYGFPLDMTADIVRGKGMSVDEAGFHQSMEEQRARSRNARASEKGLVLQRAVTAVETEFTGYEFSEYESEIIGLFNEDGTVTAATAGDEVAVVCAQTPFYAESGGQLGDIGTLNSNRASVEVIDTQKATGDTIVHICKVVDGEITKGDRVRLIVDERRRAKIKGHHSATHLLHLALRRVLGDHVRQAGSRVSAQSLRFDFTHNAALTEEQIKEIETITNTEIRANHSVDINWMGLDDAKALGAMALFDEKYGETVRVVKMGDVSTELCGGTHVSQTGNVGGLMVLSEGGISAGIRRIEAVAGEAALQHAAEQRSLLHELTEKLNVSDHQLGERVARLMERNRQLEREKDELGGQANLQKTVDLAGQAVTLSDGTKVVASVLDNWSPKQLREAADDLRARLDKACIALGSVNEGKAILLTAVSDDLVDRYHAGNLLKELSTIVGARGGGRADLAQAGGGDPEKLSLALQRFQEIVS